jgi:16S rRNA (guanine966-N2)-methyltransferase
MRILSGEAKGRVLKTREGKGTRPTDSRSREMLFNILGERVVGARFLDIYAGSGAVGLEALSRGAQFCVFIEQNAQAAQAIRENIRACGWKDRAQVWHTNMKAALRRFAELLESDPHHPEAHFDLVFADPPFTNPRELSDLAARLDNLPRLLHNGTGQKTPDFPDDAVHEPLLVVQHHRKEQFRPAQFEVWQERRAGESVLTFCRSKNQIHAAQLPVQAVPDAGAVVENAVPITVHNENPTPPTGWPEGGLP